MRNFLWVQVYNPQMENDEQAIRDFVKNWLDASKTGDTEKVLGMMTDDVVFLLCGRPPMRGKTDFAATQNALGEVDIEAEHEIQEIKVLGQWAYMWTNLSITVTPKNGSTPAKRAGNTLTILRKQDGRWLIARDANMLT